MDIRKLQRVIVDALEDVKGQDIRAFNSSGLTDLFDRVFIATGTSNRHTKALANSVRSQVKAAGGEVLSMEGEEGGEWVLVDLGDAIVHIMQPPIRSYYNLEEIWGEKPVSLKTSSSASKVPSRRFAEEPTISADDLPEAGVKTVKKALRAPAKAPARKVASKKSVGTPLAKKLPTRRATPASKSAEKSAAKSAAKSAPKRTTKPTTTPDAKAASKAARPTAAKRSTK